MSLILLLWRIFVGVNYEICLELEIASFSGYKVPFLLIIDYINVFFFRTVSLISRRIFIFRSSYINADKFSNRFLGVVLTFIIRIAFLIFRPRLISLLLGWDGLGVTSYLLVCYYRREKRFNARILTALSNRFGDVVILIFIALNLFPAVLNYGIVSFSNTGLFRTVLLIVLAAITKSAQVPFSAWLPAAIAAPTPVSALVHSSTLVTAGVYLLIRFNFVLTERGLINFITYIGCLTIIMAGAAALIELDIKKIIALSTLRQLGVIVFTLGIGERFLRWIHLISHAYFKAIIFIGAGAMIHRVRGYQDIRKIGSLNKNNFFISAIFLSGSLRLCGIPFISGFYSKDAILEQFMIRASRPWVSIITYVATIFTAMYSIRVIIMLFTSHSSRERFSAERDSNRRIRRGILALFLPAVGGGLFLSCWNQFRPLVEMPLWLKLLILSRVLISASLVKSLNLKRTPKSFFKSGVHQIWFLPCIFSPTPTNFFLGYRKRIIKFQELTWRLWAAGGWAQPNGGILYFSSLINRKLISAILMIIFFTSIY